MVAHPGYLGRAMRSVRVAAALLAAALVAAGCTRADAAPWNANLPGSVIAAAVNVGEDPATRYHGSLDGDDGKIEFDLSITNQGEGYGTLSGPFTAEVMTIDGELYIKADQKYWATEDSEKVAAYANQWVKAEQMGGGFDMSLFSPEGLDGAVEAATASIDPQKIRTAPEASVGGKKALKIEGSGATFYITSETPHRLLRVEGSISDMNGVAFDLEGLSDEDARKVYDQLTTLAKQPVHDPDASVSFVDRKFGACAVTCQVIATLRNDSRDATVYPRMVVTIHADGQARGSCTVDIPAIAPGGVRTGSCVVTSAGWQAWYRWAKRTPGYHRWEAQFQVTVRANVTATPKQPD